MAEFRTSSGMVPTTPFMRTSAGLIECAPQFRTGSGVVDAGSGSALAAQASPAYVSGARGGTTQRVFTNATTVTPSGGKAPYTYSWEAVTDWQVTSPTGATTTFSSIVAPGGDASADFTCTVTDALGASVPVYVNAVVYNYGGSGGVLP